MLTHQTEENRFFSRNRKGKTGGGASPPWRRLLPVSIVINQSELVLLTVHLSLDAVQVGRAAVANGDGGRGHPSTAIVHVQQVPRHRQLQRTNQSAGSETWLCAISVRTLI